MPNPESLHKSLHKVTALAFLVLVASGVSAQTEGVPPLEIQILDSDGRPVRNGLLEVCPQDTDCQKFSADLAGHAQVDRALLLNSGNLTVMVYDERGQSLARASAWAPSSTDLWLATNHPNKVHGVLYVQSGKGLDLVLQHDDVAPVTFPRPTATWFLDAGGVFLMGKHFGSGEETLGGGVEVEAGPGLRLGRRFGLSNSEPATRARVSYFEVVLGYSLNRYHVGAFEDHGVRDLSFHRLTLAAGPGWAWESTKISLRGVLGLGRVMDGGEVLHRLGRDYSVPAFGCSARISRHLLTLVGAPLGLAAEASALYYSASETENDHWYGLGTSILVGLTLD